MNAEELTEGPSRQTRRVRPVSPNIQLYSPQLTSVLSIVNRITGVALSLGAVFLVAWLVTVAWGPYAYSRFQPWIDSWAGQAVMLIFTLAFFTHLCGGLRHLAWDAGYGFRLRAIYASGWTVLFASVALTAITWILKGYVPG